MNLITNVNFISAALITKFVQRCRSVFYSKLPSSIIDRSTEYSWVFLLFLRLFGQVVGTVRLVLDTYPPIIGEHFVVSAHAVLHLRLKRYR
jgi:hypothetical protein